MSLGEIILTVTLAVIGSGGLSSAITICLTRWFAKKDKVGIETKATMFNLLMNLQNEARRLINVGFITRLEYQQFTEVYDTYKALGGDGWADELKAQIDELNRLTIQGGLSA